MKKHTVVLHQQPDLEALFMLHLIRTLAYVRELLGTEEKVQMKFIPSGNLRKEDWPDQEEITADALQERGYLFLDCGGGTLDQHGLAAELGANVVSSLDLLVASTRLDEILPQFRPLIAIVNGQDLEGVDVARDPDFGKSATPHTARHLKSMILGWNLMFGDQPENVADLVCNAFGGIVALIERAAVDPLQGETDEVELARVRKMFLFSNLIHGVRAVEQVAREIAGASLDLPETERFRLAGENALKRLENEWNGACRDYWNGTELIRATTTVLQEDHPVRREITVAVGTSESQRYGQVTRAGNVGPSDRRLHRGKQFREKAQVTIQFHKDSRFVISTKGIRLDRVARLLRGADLGAKGVDIRKAEVDSALGSTGNLAVERPDGTKAETLYFAEFRTALGNAFRSNAHGASCALDRDEIVSLVLKGLAL